MGKALTIDEIKNRCELVKLTYVSHYVEKQVTFVIGKCQCGESVKTKLSNITKYVRENKTYSCKECGHKKTGEAQKGKLNHMYGKKGELHHCYGTHMNEERKTKISNTAKTKYENGYENPFKGRTHSEETRQKMKDNHTDFSGEKNPMYGVRQCGELNPNYKGGITLISMHLRNLTKQWDKDVRQHYNRKCVFTGRKCTYRNSAVHHLYGFNMIVEEAHNINNIEVKKQVKDYTEEELKLLEEYVLSLHNDTSNGVLLCNEVHKLFHSLYGKGNNTPEQYEEFKIRYLNGEFENSNPINNKVA